MVERANERTAYFNGRYVPESEVLIPFRDRGFIYGEAVFDTARTFGHELRQMDEHIQRLYRSLAYIGIDPHHTADEFHEITQEVVKRNRHLVADDEDYWVFIRVTPGSGDPFFGDGGGGPTVIVDCTPIPFAARARYFRDGLHVATSSFRRTPPSALSPRAKTQNYLNLMMADREIRQRDAEAWAILLDENGNLCECLGSNIFVIRDGRLLTPRERYVLPGVSRANVMRLAGEAGIDCREADIDLFDAYGADEVFLTSTSLCMVPVSSVDGRGLGGAVPGPVTARLIDAYKAFLGFDFVDQYLRRLN